jgi:ABC-type xylose transport system permease subunit
MMPGGRILLWTIFFVCGALWMLGLAVAFGPGVMPLLLVMGTVLVLMNFVFRRTSFGE